MENVQTVIREEETPALTNLKDFFVTTFAKYFNNSQDLTAYRQDFLLKTITNFKVALADACPDFYPLVKARLKSLINRLNEINESTEPDLQKQQLFNCLLDLFKLCQLVILNSEYHVNKIIEKDLSQFRNANGMFQSLLEKIIKKSNKLVEVSHINLIKTTNLSSIPYALDNILKEVAPKNIAETDYVKQDLKMGTLFSIHFADAIGKKNLAKIYRSVSQKVANTSTLQDAQIDKSTSIKNIAYDIIQEFRAGPYSILQYTNQALSSFYKLYLEATEHEEFDKKIVILSQVKANQRFIELVFNNLKRTFEAAHDNFLQRWVYSFLTPDSGSFPDLRAQITFSSINALIKQNEAEDKLLYTGVIKELAALYESVSFANIKIKKTSLKSINEITKLLLSINTLDNLHELVEAYKYLPKEATFKHKIYQTLSKNFDSLSNAKKIEFVKSIYYQERKKAKINPQFNNYIQKIASCASELSYEELKNLIYTIRNHNDYINERHKGFAGLFRSKKELKQSVNLDIISNLQKLLDIKKTPFDKKLEEVEEGKRKLLLFKDVELSEKIHNQFNQTDSKTRQEIVTQYMHEVDNSFDAVIDFAIAKIDEKFGSDPQFKQQAAQALTLEQKLNQLNVLETWFANKQSKPAKLQNHQFSETEANELRALLAQQRAVVLAQQELTTNTQKDSQANFYAVFLNRLDTTFVALRAIASGKIQSLNDGITGILSPILSLVPKIGGAISAGLDWASRKETSMNAKVLSAIGLTSTDDAALARRLALEITKLLNNHSNENNRLENLKPEYMGSLANYILQRLVLVLTRRALTPQVKINNQYDQYITEIINEIIGDNNEKLVPDAVQFNEQFKRIFNTQIQRNDSSKIAAREILRTASNVYQEAINPAEKSVTNQSILSPTPLAQTIHVVSKDVAVLKKQFEALQKENATLRSLLIQKDQASLTQAESLVAANETSEELKIEIKVQQRENQTLKLLVEKLIREREEDKKIIISQQERVERLENTLIGLQCQVSQQIVQQQNSIVFSASHQITKQDSTILFAHAANDIKTSQNNKSPFKTKGGLALIKDRTQKIPARNKLGRKCSEIIGRFLVIRPKTAGIEPGSIAIYLDNSAYAVIKQIINNKLAEKNKKFIQRNHEEVSKGSDEIDHFLHYDDCREIIVDELKNQAGITIALIKQDYENPPGKEYKVSPSTEDFSRTNTVKDIQKRFFGTLLERPVIHVVTNLAKLARKKTIEEENCNALLEVLSTDLANLFMPTHTQKLVESHYRIGNEEKLKLMTAAVWQNGLQMLTDQLITDKSKGYLVKADNFGKAQTITVDMISAEYTQKFNGYISDNSIKNLGFYLPLFIVQNDDDGIGSKGGNKGRIDDQLFGIDFGHALREFNINIEKIQSDFSNTDVLGIKNLTIFNDRPLAEKMAGLLFLYKLRKGEESLSKEVIESYSNLYGESFMHTFNHLNKNADEKLFNNYEKYFSKYAKSSNEYEFYVSKIRLAKEYWNKAVDYLLDNTFAERLHLTTEQITVLDNLEKLFSTTTNIVEINDVNTGKQTNILLNHLHKIKRVEWNVKFNEDNIIFHTAHKNLNLIAIDYLKRHGIELSHHNNQLGFTLSKEKFSNCYTNVLTEEKIAAVKGQLLAPRDVVTLQQRHSTPVPFSVENATVEDAESLVKSVAH